MIWGRWVWGGAACAAAPGQRRQGSGAVPRRRSPRAKRERGEGERAAGERTGCAGGDASKEPQKHPRAKVTVHHAGKPEAAGPC